MKKIISAKHNFSTCMVTLFALLVSMHINAATTAFEKNELQIVMTPDGYPVLWFSADKYNIDFIYNSALVTGCSSGCSAEATTSGATSFRAYQSGQYVTVTAFYNAGGDVVGTSSVDNTPQLLVASANANTSSVVGSVSGEFSVAPQGSANYSVSIDVPPGIAGVQPGVGIAYSSQSGNGDLGVGWALTGLSSISRCPKTLAFDGYLEGGVNFTTSDRLCFNGQRLILTTGLTRNNSAYWSVSAVYELENSSSVRVTRYGTGFMVREKGGGFSEYGNTPDSNRNVTNIRTGQKPTLDWSVNRVSDVSGNYFTYHYTENVTNGEHYLNRINYTGNTAKNIQPFASIRFEYVARPDPKYGYISGAKTDVLMVLSHIRTYSNNANNALVKDYKLFYEQETVTNKSRLKTLSECNAFAECKNSTLFNWSDDIHGKFEITKETSNGVNSALETVKLLDINGDGFTDWVSVGQDYTYVRLSNGDGTFKPFKKTYNGDRFAIGTIKFADINGDGRADWVSTGGRYTYVRFSNGDGSFQNSKTTYNGDTFATQTLQLSDMNADGLTDWVSTGGQYTYVRFSNGDGTFGASTITYNGDVFAIDTLTLLDINGDGYIDWVSTGGQYTYVRLSNGNGTFKSYIKTYNGDAFTISTIKFTDINGDGLIDWVSTGGRNTYVRFSRGDGYFEDAVITDNGDTFAIESIRLADMNADGLADWVSVSGGFTYVRLSYGNGEFANAIISDNGSSFIIDGIKLVDMNGDGLTDWVASDLPNTFVRMSSGGVANYITSTVDGFGNQANINYKSIVGTGVYTQDLTDPECAKLEISCTPYPKYVVSDKTTTDGLEGTVETRYLYNNNKVNLRGRGELGFRWTESNNTQTGLVTRVNYYQNYPYTSMVNYENQTLNGKKLSYTKNIPASFTLGNASPGKGRDKIYLKSSLVEAYDSNGAKLSTITTLSETRNNPNGDITKVEVITQNSNDALDKLTTTTTNTYGYSGSSNFNLLSLVTSTSAQKTGQIGASPKVIQNFEYNLQTYKLLSEYGSVNGLTGIKKAYAYTDGFGHINSTTITGPDIEARIVTTEYDARGQFAKNITNEMGHTLTTTYDPVLGVPLTKTDANNLVTTYAYDSWGKVTDVYAPGGNTTHTEQSWCQISCTLPAINNNVSAQVAKFISTTSVAGGSSLIKYAPDVVVYYDKLGREIRKQTTNFKGETIYVDTAYDNLGRIVAQTQPYFAGRVDKNETVSVYDVLGRVVKSTTPGEGVSTVVYNESALEVTTSRVAYNPLTLNYETQTSREKKNIIGQVLYNTDNDGNILFYAYDAQGNKVKTFIPKVDANGNKLNNVDANGNVIESQSHVIQIGYDAFGRKRSMIDPNMGSWSYTYDSTSKLRTQTDANGQTTTMNYDRLGRMVNRTDADGRKTYWVYNDDKARGNTPNVMSVGKLDTVYQMDATGFEEYRQDMTYTADLGLVNTSTTIIEEGSAAQSKKVRYETQSRYDQFHRPEVIDYPQTSPNKRLQLKYVYTNGALTEVNNANGSVSYWQAKEVNAQGQITLADYGVSDARPSGVVSQIKGHDIAGRLTFLDYSSGLSTLYTSTYQYSEQGSLVYRKSLRNNTLNYLTEKYYYDSLQRLTRVNINNNANAQLYTYDVLGNIRSKTGQGTFQYTNGKPHAVSNVNGSNYLYNNNGAITNGGGRNVSWSAFNKPSYISNAGGYSTFNYGPSRARYKQFSREYATATAPLKDITTIYVGGSYEKVTESGKIKHKHYIKVAGKTIAQYTVTQSTPTDVGTNKLEFLLRDNQGSTVAVINASGGVTAQMDYDAFGSRRPILGANTLTSVIQDIPRGYTGHEHLSKLGLIHMNGRVYDPKLGRFLSADPIIQFSKNIQSYNRFSYVLNNPMSYTDPSGFSLERLVKRAAQVAIGTTLIASGNAVNAAVMYSKPVMGVFLKYQWARIGLQIGASIYGQGLGAALASAYLTDISGGTLGDVAKSAAIAYASTEAFIHINSEFALVQKIMGTPLNLVQKAIKVLAHGAVGGVASELGGGEFSKGFLVSAGIEAASQYYTGVLEAERARVKKAHNYDVKGSTKAQYTFGNGKVTTKIKDIPVADFDGGTTGLNNIVDSIDKMAEINSTSWSLVHEGGFLMRFLDRVPIFNQMPKLHDIWGAGLEQIHPVLFHGLNVPTMGFGLVVSTSALLGRTPGVVVSNQHYQNSRNRRNN